MRAVIQRVNSAAVDVSGRTVAEINEGLLVLVGLHPGDTEKDREYIINKILNLRIFNDSNDTMNLSLKDRGGEALIVSQFTLYGNAHKGNRPSYAAAMPSDIAENFFAEFVADFRDKFPGVKSGLFGAHMKVRLINDGPVTILIDSKKTF